MNLQNDRSAQSSGAEDLFVDLFAQVFGFEKTQLLVPEYPVRDLLGNPRFIDFAIKSAARKIAFEIDGPSHYGGMDFSVLTYEDDLLRQNSLIHDEWQVYRWTDRQLAHEPDAVKEQLAFFLAGIPGLLSLDDFLPKQSGAASSLDLRTHQQEALDWLATIRVQGHTIALLDHATGSGKTFAAIRDAQRFGPRVLYVAHTRDLIEQTAAEFRAHWPEVTHGRLLGGIEETDCDVLCATIQSISRRLSDFAPDAFRYLIIDEAHHAAAESYRNLLGYFQPSFTLGLTATPERPDGQPILELFRDAAHRLSLQEAIQRGELVPIRCVRVKTNVDLSRVRFNEVQYNRRDLEQTLLVPARDQLIVETYLEHVKGRKGVAFCVNVRHGEELAALFRQHGVAARAVSGVMPNAERERVLKQYALGQLRMLCACDILNEGWDCPDVEVLLMARPTLSRIIYMQQLGRGTRKSPGKESLLVFDFVDNPGRYNASFNIHRLTGTKHYRKGGLVVAPDADLERERALFERGEAPPIVLNLGLWAEDYEEVDLFNWQTAAQDMLTVSELESRLGVAETFFWRKVQTGELQPDHRLEIGQRTYSYFRKDRLDEIRQQFGIEPVTADTIHKRFMDFCEVMDMNASYKPVFLRALFASVDAEGTADIESLSRSFRDFYAARSADGQFVERAKMRMSRVQDLSDADVQLLMLQKPFRQFAQRGYLSYGRDVARVRFDKRLWRCLSDDDRRRLGDIADANIRSYYAKHGLTAGDTPSS